MSRYRLRFQLSQPTPCGRTCTHTHTHTHTEVALFSLLRPIDVFRVAARRTRIDELAKPLVEKKRKKDSTHPSAVSTDTTCLFLSFLFFSFYYYHFFLILSFSSSSEVSCFRFWRTRSVRVRFLRGWPGIHGAQQAFEGKMCTDSTTRSPREHVYT